MSFKVGVVGVGRFGGHHARILSSLPEVELVGVMDTQPKRAEEVARANGTRVYDRLEPLLDHVQALTVAVPTVDHLRIGGAALEKGIPTFIEKPLAKTVQEGEKLVRLAGERRTILQVGHVERFNPALGLIHGRVRAPCYIEAHRLSPYPQRSTDVDVVLDVMIHDIDIALHLIEAPLRRVDAIGFTLLFGREDMANARLEFEDGSVVNVTANRVSTKRKRIMRIMSLEAYASIDFMQRSAVVYRLSPELTKVKAELPAGGIPTEDQLQKLPSKFYEVESLQADGGEDALSSELGAFIAAARGDGPVVVSGAHGLRAMQVAEAVLAEIRGHTLGGGPS